MKTLICFIGTQRYFYFFEKYYQTINEMFLPKTQKDFLILTDYNYSPRNKNEKVIQIKHINWPYVTLFRFKNILKSEQLIKDYDLFIFIDADMYAHRVITEHEFFTTNKNFFGVQHPLYTNNNGTFETDYRSLSCVLDYEDKSIYWQGCFWGGRVPYIIDMIKELDRRVDIDLSKKIMAKWHDESHLNKFFIENKKQVHTYDSGYCYPEIFLKSNCMSSIDKKLIHIEKPHSCFKRFSGGIIL